MKFKTNRLKFTQIVLRNMRKKLNGGNLRKYKSLKYKWK